MKPCLNETKQTKNLSEGLMITGTSEWSNPTSQELHENMLTYITYVTGKSNGFERTIEHR